MKSWIEGNTPITINEHGSFDVAGMDDSHYASLADARVAAQAFETRQKATKRIKVSLPILTEDGREGTITGFNAAHGKVLVSGIKVDRWDKLGACYPPSVKAMIELLVGTRAIVEKIKADLAKYRIEIPESRYGRTPDIEDMIKTLKASYAKCETAARRKNGKATQ